MDFGRIKKLQRNLENPILIKKPDNLFYLLGRKFLHGYLLVLPLSTKHLALSTSVVFFGDGLELPPHGIISDRLKNIPLFLTKISRLELEDEFTFAESNYIREKLNLPSGGQRAKIKIVHQRSPVDYQRAIKETPEIQMIKKSMQIVEKVFLQVRKKIKSKPSEIELAEFIKKTGLKFGAEDVSFPPIVASGANAAIPHHVPYKKRIKSGESVIIDMGFKYKGYCSDFTRTLFIKSIPKKLEIAYNQVEKAYIQSTEFIRPGIIAGKVYDKAVKILAQKHLEKYFIHSLGHGTGLEIHELPNLSPKSKDVLPDGMVFSIEPGVYIPRVGGIRIEDLVYLKKGKVEKFINVPTHLKENIL